MPLFGTKKEASKKCPKKEKEEGKMPSVEDKYVLKDLLGTICSREFILGLSRLDCSAARGSLAGDEAKPIIAEVKALVRGYGQAGR
ncbi:hypothetical protein E2C01_058724 [Portunus trituberculatus]|uniref:Uncharacterized protein n=1 Tax=Portunus trituberculatus TaxID=210409 RepID=A0A5B7H5I6_PORTR|nr:hypothetical protein [Portunus trituberculatus]